MKFVAQILVTFLLSFACALVIVFAITSAAHQLIGTPGPSDAIIDVWLGKE